MSTAFSYTEYNYIVLMLGRERGGGGELCTGSWGGPGGGGRGAGWYMFLRVVVVKLWGTLRGLFELGGWSGMV